MIESANPEIDVEELMRRVAAEAARIRRTAGATVRRTEYAPVLPQKIARPLPPLPRAPVPRRVETKKDRLDSLVQEAREKSEGNRRIPKIFRRFFRKQGACNRLILDAVASLAKTAAQLGKRLQELAVAHDGHARWLRTLADHHASATAPEVAALAAEVDELRAQLEDMKAQLEQLRSDGGSKNTHPEREERA